MTTHTGTIRISTERQDHLINITSKVQEIVRAAQVSTGLCCISVTHTTAGLYVNEDDGPLKKDVLEMLEKLAPAGKDYQHNHVDPNAQAHLRRILTGGEVTLPIIDGQLQLGTWQKILLAEYDGPRQREAQVVVIGE